jgi:urease subunit gamma/beta
MHLSPRDIEKLMLHNAGFLAQKRLARGVKLNYPESVALIATQVLEFIRDNRPVAELMDLGRRFLGRRQVMPGVPEMVVEVQLVTVHHPIASIDGDLALALYGSFLPIPALSVFGDGGPAVLVGNYETVPGDLTLNEGRAATELAVTNLGDRPVQVGSHYHFIETNASLKFDRALAYGKRLDIPAGTAVRFEPGDTKTVALVDIAGNKVIRGGNALADGPVTDAGRVRAMKNVAEKQFASS